MKFIFLKDDETRWLITEIFYETESKEEALRVGAENNDLNCEEYYVFTEEEWTALKDSWDAFDISVKKASEFSIDRVPKVGSEEEEDQDEQ